MAGGCCAHPWDAGERVRSWKKRFFVLRHDGTQLVFEYYKQPGGELLGSFNLKDRESFALPVNRAAVLPWERRGMTVSAVSRTYRMGAETEAELGEWEWAVFAALDHLQRNAARDGVRVCGLTRFARALFTPHLIMATAANRVSVQEGGQAAQLDQAVVRARAPAHELRQVAQRQGPRRLCRVGHHLRPLGIAKPRFRCCFLRAADTHHAPPAVQMVQSDADPRGDRFLFSVETPVRPVRVVVRMHGRWQRP
jgi:hypothetical protein